jgi:hypothetical protein
MPNHPRSTTLLGDLIAAEFDRAALASSDPREISQLATLSVVSRLRGATRAGAKLPAAS